MLLQAEVAEWADIFPQMHIVEQSSLPICTFWRLSKKETVNR